MNKKVFVSLIFLSTCVLFSSWRRPYIIFEDQEKTWVDSVYNSMTLDERLGQLFMVAAYSNMDARHEQKISDLITQYKIGGLIFMQGGPERQIRLTNKYQSLSKIPLMIAMDAEWGLNMRLDSTLQFPRQMTLGAIRDNELIYKMGESMAKECRRMGVHVNFAPVVDVNVNPRNPVIGTRSFGEDKVNVANKGIAITNGMQDFRVMGVAKHFPGHGDTDKDSHLALPVIRHDRKRLDEVELYPFQKIFDSGVKGVMVAHLHIPALDSKKNVATTLSEKVVTGLLINEMKYEGLIFTDALGMKGVSEFNKPGEVDELAFLAGNDVLLFSGDVPLAVAKLKKSFKKGKITEERLARSVKKILAAKYWSGLSDYKPVPMDNIYQDLNSDERKSLIEELYASAITVARNDEKVLPVNQTKYKKIACINLRLDADFGAMCSNFGNTDVFNITDLNDVSAVSEIMKKQMDYEAVIVGVGNMSNSRGSNYGLNAQVMNFLNRLNKRNNLVVCLFGNAYSLKNFDGFKNVICAYDENKSTVNHVPQVIFGARKADGKLPVTASPIYTVGTGISIASLQKLGFATPQSQGMNVDTLQLLDSIVQNAIDMEAMPGCQVLVARNGKVVMQKAYGYFTYDKKKPVTNNTVYDLASITKVAATLQVAMKLHEEGKLDINQRVSHYLEELKGTDKEYMKVKDVLLHQAGLAPYMLHWTKTVSKQEGMSESYYCDEEDSWFCKKVNETTFTTPALSDSMWKWTIMSELREPNNLPPATKNSKKKKKKVVAPSPDMLTYDYVYSDLSFYVMKELVERISGSPLDAYVEKNIYGKLGFKYLTYNPLEKYNIDIIAPTEKDKLFRNGQVRGYVHDQGAAMLGGVGGHAGLFSNAYELAQLMQMNLQGGTYDGQKIFSNDTVVRFFASKQVPQNRRGLGWDKPFEQNKTRGNSSPRASSETFGHTGFTGTCVWVDPKYNLVFVFLSNRVYPDVQHTKLMSESIRPKIQDVIYRSFGAPIVPDLPQD